MTQKPNMKIVTTATQYNNMSSTDYSNAFQYSRSDYVKGDACKSAIIKFLLDKGYTHVLEAVDGISVEAYSDMVSKRDPNFSKNLISDAICIRLIALTGKRVDGLYEELFDFLQNDLNL